MNILCVVSAARCLTLAGGGELPAGTWVPELVLPWEALVADGHRLQLASPGGAPPVPDPQSMSQGPETWQRRLAALPAPATLAEVRGVEWDAVVLPGGYAPAEDLPGNDDLGEILRRAADRDAVIAAICHAPAALLAARIPGGEWVFRGKRMTCFSDAEEAAWLGARRPARLVESSLRAAGAEVTVAPPWGSHCVTDGGLVTAQNSPSTAAFITAIRQALARR